MNDAVFMDACTSACHVEVHRMLEEQKHKHTNHIHPEVIKDAFQQMCGVRGIQSIAQLILEQMPSEFTTGDLNVATRIACENGHLDIAQWLASIYPAINIEGHHEGWHFCDPVFYVVCLRGHLEVAQWIYMKQNSEYYKVKRGLSYLCTHVADIPDPDIQEKQKKIADWLYSLDPEGMQTYLQQCGEYLWMGTCSNGNLPLAKWIYEKNPALDYDGLFYISCTTNQLAIAKWLYSIHPEMDISINNEMTFCDTCFKGHLEIVQWLFEIKPTLRVHTRNHFAIKVAHRNNHSALFRWLVERYPLMYSLQPLPPPSNRFFLKIHKVAQLPFGNPICTIIRNHYETSTCTICCEYDCAVELNCKHSFCENCISTWYDKNQTCPLCRTDIRACEYIRYERPAV